MKPEKRKRPRETDISPGAPTDPPPVPRGESARRKLPRISVRPVLYVLVPTILIALGPTILLHTPLRDWCIRTAAGVNGRVKVQSLSIGWLSALSATGVEIHDADDQPVLQADGVSGTRGILGLLTHRSAPGTFRIEKPKLTLALSSSGSNVENVFGKWFGGPASSSGVAVGVVVVDGEVQIIDQTTQQTWQIGNLQLALDMAKEYSLPAKLEASADLVDARQPGKISVTCHVGPGEAPTADSPAPPGSSGELNVTSNNIPLAAFQRVLGRALPQAMLTGTVGTSFSAKWNGTASMTLKGAADTSGLVVGGACFGREQLRLDQVHGECTAAIKDGRLQIVSPTGITSSIGKFQASSTIDLNDQGIDGIAAALARQAGSIEGTLDLAALAKLIPGTLGIRPGSEITSGELQVKLSTAAANGPAASGGTATAAPAPVAWTLDAQTSRLAGRNGGRDVAWERPLHLMLKAHQAEQGPVVDSLQCESDFLNLKGEGTFDKLTATVAVQLKPLADQLGQFGYLGGVAMAGEGQGKLQITRGADQAFQAGGDVRLTNLQVNLPGRQPWAESAVDMTLAASGKAGGGTVRLDAASLNVRSGDEQFDVQLAPPAADAADVAPPPPSAIVIRAHGQCERLPGRLAPLVDLQGVRMGGTYDGTAQVAAMPGGIGISDAKFSITSLILAMPGLNVQEPRAEVTFTGALDRASSGVKIVSASLVGSAVAIQAKDVQIAPAANGGLQTIGAVSYRGNLQRISDWLPQPAATPGNAAPPRMTGEIVGTAQLQQAGGPISCQTDAEITNLVVGSGPGSFQEPRVHLMARAVFQPQDRTLRLDQFELTSSIVGAKGSAQVVQGQTQFDGRMNYDWEKVCLLLRPYLGPNVSLYGQGAGPFTYQGPLSLAQGQATASLQFGGAALYGFQLGRGEMKLRLAGGVLQAEPMQVTCNQGRLTLAPQLQIAPTMQLNLPAGNVAENIQLDPAVCRTALHYVMPTLASVTQSQGSFSIQLDGCRLPFNNLSQAVASGRVVIHTAQVSPGPIVQGLASLASGQLTLASIKSGSVVPFKLIHGRVYHENLELQFPELTVRTRGSVGLDDSLTLLAEVSLRPLLLAGTAAGSAMQAQPLQIPIGGTLDRFQIDKRAFVRQTGQAIGNTAAGVIQQGIGKDLGRLLGNGKQ